MKHQRKGEATGCVGFANRPTGGFTDRHNVKQSSGWDDRKFKASNQTGVGKGK